MKHDMGGDEIQHDDSAIIYLWLFSSCRSEEFMMPIYAQVYCAPRKRCDLLPGAISFLLSEHQCSYEQTEKKRPRYYSIPLLS